MSLDFCSNNRKIQDEYQEQVPMYVINSYCKKVPNEKTMVVLSEHLKLHWFQIVGRHCSPSRGEQPEWAIKILVQHRRWRDFRRESQEEEGHES